MDITNNWTSSDADSAHRATVTQSLLLHLGTCRALRAAILAVDRSVELPELDAAAIEQVVKYLGAGPDIGAQNALLRHTVQSFLYLLHETVELLHVGPLLNKPRPRSIRRADGEALVQSDLWRANFSSLHEQVKSADLLARIAEAHAEAVLLRLLLGIETSPRACAETLELSSFTPATSTEKQSLDKGNQTMRRNVATAIGGDEATDRERELASTGRVALYAVPLATIASKYGTTRELAIALWDARSRPCGQDWHDWFAAEQILSHIAG